MNDQHLFASSASGVTAGTPSCPPAAIPRGHATSALEPGASRTVHILGVPFSRLSYDEAAWQIRDLLHSGARHQVVLANAHTLNHAYEHPSYHQAIAGASLILRDGIGVELASILVGQRLAHNFVGTDFVPRLLRSLGDLQPSVFLYGAAPGVAAAAAHVLQERCPAIRVAGTEHGYVDPAGVIRAIRVAQPNVLLVALGNPLQEMWIARHLDELNAGVAIGVGALFDYLAGRVVRAPQWVRSLRCEWMFRLLVEPRRLWQRYLLGNPLFLWRIAHTLRKARS